MDDSNQTTTTEATAEPIAKEDATSSTDDLFKGTMSKEPASDKASEPEIELSKMDAPSNITITPEKPIVIDEPSSGLQDSKSGSVQTYKVQKGETLMQIAFKIYGDVSRWKDLKQMNNNKITANNSLRSLTEIKYMAPAHKFVWEPTGTPYIIKTGETLGTISNSVYQTPKKWKKIWENNKPLIKNPNVIYAGFTVYYKAPADLADQQTTKQNEFEINNIDEEISNIQSATEKTTNEISPLAE
jgi:nucleoid-associated protein YgaU